MGVALVGGLPDLREQLPACHDHGGVLGERGKQAELDRSQVNVFVASPGNNLLTAIVEPFGERWRQNLLCLAAHERADVAAGNGHFGVVLRPEMRADVP